MIQRRRYLYNKERTERRETRGSTAMDWKFEFECSKASSTSMHRNVQGIGASNAVAAHAAIHVPRPALQATIIGGAAGAATVPKVNPAAA